MGQGEVQQGVKAFAAAGEGQGLRDMAGYQTALALALDGDYERAAQVLAGGQSGPTLALTPRGHLAQAQILVQLGRRAGAQAGLAAFSGQIPPQAQRLHDRIASGVDISFDHITTPAQGMGEVLYTLAEALKDSDVDPSVLLLYTRLAAFLDPRNIDALLLSAEFLKGLNRPELATEVYNAVPSTHPAFLQAELGRANALRQLGRVDAAIEVLRQLAQTAPSQRQVHIALGDTLRRAEHYALAQVAYDKAIALTPAPTRGDWFLYFARGVTFERTDQWERAEADFRTSIALSDTEALVLNYLGYSLVERGGDLGEALDLIQRAIAARPDAGFIVDSLGWVLYRQGAFEQAVEHLERAAALTATDPTINDHLGDAYWQVGRRVEARFQWRRAQSFDPEPDLATRIARKLEVGLDTVLAEEAAAAQ